MWNISTVKISVCAGVEAWKKGDLNMFGGLMKESGYSSIYSYETGSDELKTMYDIICKAPGMYGGRFSGAGFNGSSIALIAPEARGILRDLCVTSIWLYILSLRMCLRYVFVSRLMVWMLRGGCDEVYYIGCGICHKAVPAH